MPVRKFILPLIIITCAASSCFKATQRVIFKLAATYDSTSTTSNVVKVSAQKTSGDDDIITLSVEGLPDFIEANISQPQGPLPWTTNIIFSFNNTYANQNVSLWNYYTVTIKGASASGTYSTTNVRFYCAPYNAVGAFDGISMFAHENCTPSGSDILQIYITSPGGNTIQLNNFYQTLSATYNVPAIVDGKARTISIPAYTQDYYTFRGNGTFYPTGYDSIGCTIHYSRSTVSTFDTCTMVLSMKP